MDTLHQLFTGAFLLVGNTTRRSRAAVELAAFSNEGMKWALAIALMVTLAIGFGTLLVTLSVYQ